MPSALISLLLRCSILILLLLSSLNLTVAESLMPALVLQESQQKRAAIHAPSTVHFRELQKHYLATINTTFDTPQFHKNFAALDEFISSPQFSHIDFSGNEAAYFTWIMDYAYWLILQSEQLPQKEARLQKLKAHIHLRALLTPEILSQDIQLGDTIPASFYALDESHFATISPLYFYLLHKAGTYNHNASAIYKDDLRLYCYNMLLQKRKIPTNIQNYIAFTLKVESPSLQNCTPHIFLLNAVKKRDYKEISRLIDQGIPVNQISAYVYNGLTNEPRYDENYAPLVHAVKNNDLIAAGILIDQHPDDNAADLSINYGIDAAKNIMSEALSPAIFRYAASGYTQFDTEMLDLLLINGANINASTPYSYLLSYALNNQFSDDHVLRYLLKKGADPNLDIAEITDIPLYIALHQAAYPAHYPRKQNFVKILIEEGHANINSVYIRRYIQPKGSQQSYPEYVTPIYHFLQSLSQQKQVSDISLQTLKYILDSGADLTIGGICLPNKNCDSLNNGWEEILKVVNTIPSQSVQCLIDAYRPKEIAPNHLYVFCIDQ